MLPLVGRGRRRSLARVATFPASLALAGLLVAGDAAALAGEEKTACPPAPVGMGAGAVVGGTGERARLKPTTGPEQTTLKFRSREPKALDLRANIIGTGPPPGTRVSFDARRFRNANGDEIPTRQVEIIACVGRGGEQVIVEVRVDPGAPTPVRPGAYQAEFVVDDPAFDTVSSIPFEVTVLLPDPLYYPILLLGVVVLVAVAAQRLLRRLENPDQVVKASLSSPRVWRLSTNAWELVAAFGAGAIATVPVYLAHYERDPAWTFDMTHSWGFATTAFAAASAAVAGSATYFRRRPRGGGPGANG